MALDAGGGGSGWSAEQKRNAAIIVSVGRRMGMSKRDIVIGLMTALQESTLRNLDYGDRDSLGLFQQRPSQGWGSRQQVTDPYYASKKFFSALKGVRGRNRMSLTRAAQAVQRSAYPDAYAKWETDARSLLGRVSGRIAPAQGGSPGRAGFDPGPRGRDALAGGGFDSPLDPLQGKYTPTQPTGPTPLEKMGNQGYVPDIDTSIGGGDAGSGAMGAPGAPGLSASSDPMTIPTGMQSFGSVDDYIKATGGGRFGQKGVNNTRKALVELAKQSLGVPYKWGGTDLSSGVDCSGFIQSVYKEMGINIPRVSFQQASYGKRVGLGKLRPGDLVAWDNSSRNDGADHIAIYIGNGRIIEAPRTGLSVRIRRLGRDEGAWGVAMNIK